MTIKLPYEKFRHESNAKDLAESKLLPPWLDGLVKRINDSAKFTPEEKESACYQLGVAKEEVEYGLDSGELEQINSGLDVMYDVCDVLRIWVD